ncbi:hypothetical protein ABIB40_004183 [Pedobacter sp. UYP30]|uniref:hypothetical protein n=1 Tax=Pedobacter sp. UYP30 TaxID=1756400 RepID=UPI003397CCED
MSFFDFLSDQSYNKELLTLRHFSADYSVACEVTSVTENQHEPLIYLTELECSVQQEILPKEIVNILSLRNTKISTEEDSFKKHIPELIALSEISQTYKLARNLKGEVKEIRNTEELQRDWEIAKTELIPKLYQTHWQRRGFILGYKKGLPKMHLAISNNWQFLLMIPDTYHFNHYTGGNESTTENHTYRSGLLSNFSFDYQMRGISYERNGNTIKLTLRNKNEESLISSLRNLEQSVYELKKYLFVIEATYHLDALTGKVISATADVKEEINDTYSISKKLSIKIIESGDAKTLQF